MDDEPAQLGDRTNSSLQPDPSPGSASALYVPEPSPLPFSPQELLVCFAPVSNQQLILCWPKIL